MTALDTRTITARAATRTRTKHIRGVRAGFWVYVGLGVVLPLRVRVS